MKYDILLIDTNQKTSHGLLSLYNDSTLRVQTAM